MSRCSGRKGWGEVMHYEGRCVQTGHGSEKSPLYVEAVWGPLPSAGPPNGAEVVPIRLFRRGL